MSDPTDFPAAHSMDTEWFAVDKNGHVATFTSHASGAVPSQFLKAYGLQTFIYKFVTALWTHPRKTSKVNIPPLMGHPVTLNGEPCTWEALPDWFGSVIVRHSHRLDPSENCVRVDVPEGTFSELYSYSKSEALKKFNSGEFTHVWVGTDLITFFGLFSYAHGRKWENWIAGPYEREGFPLVPIDVSELPTEMLRQAPVVLTNDFVKDQIVQPVESVPCQAHQIEYVSSDERTIRLIATPDLEVHYLLGPDRRAELEKQGFVFDHPNDEQKP